MNNCSLHCIRATYRGWFNFYYGIDEDVDVCMYTVCQRLRLDSTNELNIALYPHESGEIKYIR